MRVSSNQISRNNISTRVPFGARAQTRRRAGLTPGGIFMALLITFVAVAAMQALQLNSLLSTAKTVGQDIVELRAEQKIILSSYSSYKDRLAANIYFQN